MKALFPGSFNPFTKGHADIVDRALKLFDEIVVGIGINAAKRAPSQEEVQAHERLKAYYKDNPRVQVTEYSCLTVDLCQNLGIDVIVRGVRSMKDFEYERQMADVNRKLTGVETVVLFADPAYESLSSSLVREIAAYGHDVSTFII
ncbi:MAG: pantetheine-phosphate adenylyltransferase [Bacteroidaceae bacterium]|nr:pantetheine-phosphate adenylyltransferase [Bacteroidaceae bacterium]